MVLVCLQSGGDVALVPAESAHQWRVLRNAISHLNEIRFCSIHLLAVNIHHYDRYIDVGSIRLRYEVDAVFVGTIEIWMVR